MIVQLLGLDVDAAEVADLDGVDEVNMDLEILALDDLVAVPAFGHSPRAVECVRSIVRHRNVAIAGTERDEKMLS